MANVELEDSELDLLLEILEREIPDLRDEIFHTDDREYKKRLKQREQHLADLLKKLKNGKA